VTTPGRSRIGLLTSFGHAARGLVEVTARERNMKLHLLAGMAVGLLGTEVALSRPAQLALVICTMLVIAGEAMNGALEALVDLHTVELRPEARVAKDAAAGAVLALALGSVVVLGCVLGAEWGAVTAFFRTGGWGASLTQDVGILACTGFLLSPTRRPRSLDAVVAVTAAVLLVVAAGRGVSVAMTAVSGLLLVLAVLATRCRAP
jgi:diacylglycerol kinase (ATP)